MVSDIHTTLLYRSDVIDISGIADMMPNIADCDTVNNQPASTDSDILNHVFMLFSFFVDKVRAL